MPKINVTTPFNFQSGADTTHYAKGEQDVPQAVADHAIAKGFSPKPKDEKKTETPAAPATKA